MCDKYLSIIALFKLQFPRGQKKNRRTLSSTNDFFNKNPMYESDTCFFFFLIGVTTCMCIRITNQTWFIQFWEVSITFYYTNILVLRHAIFAPIDVSELCLLQWYGLHNKLNSAPVRKKRSMWHILSFQNSQINDRIEYFALTVCLLSPAIMSSLLAFGTKQKGVIIFIIFLLAMDLFIMLFTFFPLFFTLLCCWCIKNILQFYFVNLFFLKNHFLKKHFKSFYQSVIEHTSWCFKHEKTKQNKTKVAKMLYIAFVIFGTEFRTDFYK